MDQAGQQGMLGGITDASQFRQRFKNIVNQVREVAKVMGGTLEDVAPLMGEMRNMGVWRPEDVMGTAVAMRQAGPQGAPGLMQTMSAGARGSFAAGGNLTQGAMTGRAQFQNVQAAVQTGVLSQEAITNLTGGVGGAQGQQMVSQRLTGIMQQMTQTPGGRLMAAGLGETQDGSFTGRLDQEKLQQFLSGGVSVQQLQSQGMRATGNEQGAASFTAHQNTLMQSVAAEGGIGGAGQMVKAALQKMGRGGASPAIQQLMIEKMYDLNSRDAQLLQRMVANLDKVMDKRVETARATLEDSLQRAEESQNHSFKGLSDALGQAYEDTVERPIQEFGEKLTSRSNEAIDRLTGVIMGRRSKTRITRSQRIQAIMEGGTQGAQQRLAARAGGDLNARSVEEMLDTPFAERVRTAGFGALTGGGGRGELAAVLTRGRSRHEGMTITPGESGMPGMAVGQGPGEGEVALGEGLVARKEDVREGMQRAVTRTRASFTTKKAFGGSVRATQLMGSLTNKYRETIANHAADIEEFKKNNKSPHKRAAYIEGLMRKDPAAQAYMEELRELQGGAAGDTGLDVVTLAAKEAGDPEAGVDRMEMGRETGVFDVNMLTRGSDAREEYIQKSLTMATQALSGTTDRATKAGMGMALTSALGPIGTAIAAVGEATGLMDRAGAEVGNLFSDVSREEIYSAMEGDYAEDIKRVLAGGPRSEALLDKINSDTNSPEARILKGAQKMKPGEKEQLTEAFARQGDLRKADINRGMTEAQQRLAKKELRQTGKIKGVRSSTRQTLDEVLELASSADEGDRQLALERAESLSGSLSPQEIKAFVKSGGAFAGSIAGQARAGRLSLTGKSEAGFRKEVGKISEAMGFDVLGTLESVDKDKFTEIMQSFDKSSGGGREMSKTEADRAKEFISKLTGAKFSQEKRSAQEDANAKMNEQLTKYTEANTAFVTAVDVFVDGKGLGGAVNDILRRRREVSNSSQEVYP
jgi:hypothetical protein